jgi:hypothetical protein
MKNFFCIAYLIAFITVFSCKKERLITSSEARLNISVDMLRFDTVFTSVGSITQSFKIFNGNNQRLKLNKIKIMGGSSSFFKMNADGIAGTEINNLEIAANDSIYVFVTVTVDPNSNNLPFIVQDSILVAFNGNERLVQLEAYGQNARFIRSELIGNNTTWNSTLPYVILGGVQVDTNVTLTLQPGTRVYLHADAPLIVDGTLLVNGTKTDSVVFLGDRLDKEYRDLPASWPGIYFRGSSKDNVLKYAVVKNAFQGIVIDKPSVNTNPKAVLNECIIDNIYDAGIFALNSSIKATNCLISNCGTNILLVKGGNYEFTHCTVASYSNNYILHKNPVLFVNNWDSINNQVFTYNLTALFRNNIFWGENGTTDDEVVVSKRGSTTFDVVLRNNLFKAKTTPPNTVLTDNISNQNPLFDSIDVVKRYYDFRIGLKASPAIDKGLSLGVVNDLDNKPRDSKPDMGCYEKQ